MFSTPASIQVNSTKVLCHQRCEKSKIATDERVVPTMSQEKNTNVDVMGLVGFGLSQIKLMTHACTGQLIVEKVFLTCTVLLGVPETNFSCINKFSGCTGHF